jgi:hypothetical protein
MMRVSEEVGRSEWPCESGAVASWMDVGRALKDLPGITKHAERREWRVKDKLVAWERPLRKADLAALGNEAPKGAILGVYTPLDLKDVLLTSRPAVYFTTPHFDGWPALLVRLPAIPPGELRDLLREAWLARAPKKLVAELEPGPSTKKTPVKPPARKAAGKMRSSGSAARKKPRVFAISFASVYPLYLQKAANKGRTKDEVDAVIQWLTGYDSKKLQRTIKDKIDLEVFFAQAPRLNPNAALIKGVVCGVRVEDIGDPLMRKIRYLDKLIDELARGKKMETILRT